MHSATTEIHTRDRKRTAKAPICAAVPQPAATPIRCNYGLTLPKLPSSVPASYTIQENAVESSLNLLTFVDAGLISEEDVPEKWQANDTIIGDAINRWAAKQSSKLNLFDMRIVYSESLGQLIINSEIDQEELIKACDADPEQKTINIGIYANSWDEIFIGKKMEELEASVPGFGKTVMAHLSRETSSTTMYCVTPQEVFGMCTHLYWMGDNSEEEMLEELLSQMGAGEEFEAEKEGIIKKSDLYASMPEWSVECETLFTVDQIRELATDDGSLVAQVAKALLPIAENKGKHEMLHSVPIMDNHISPALLIRWNELDMTTQVYDDYNAYLCESDESNDIHRYFITNHDPDQLKDTFECIEKFIDNTAKVDALLRLLMEV